MLLLLLLFLLMLRANNINDVQYSFTVIYKNNYNEKHRIQFFFSRQHSIRSVDDFLENTKKASCIMHMCISNTLRGIMELLYLSSWKHDGDRRQRTFMYFINTRSHDANLFSKRAKKNVSNRLKDWDGALSKCLQN